MSKTTVFVILFMILVGITGFYIVKISTKPESEVTEKGIEKAVENEKSEITITTDKTKYKQGEQIKASVHYDELYVMNRVLRTWSIQRKINNSWAYLPFGWNAVSGSVCREMECKDVPPNKIVDCIICELEPPKWNLIKEAPITFTWNQRYIAGAGTYQCYNIRNKKIVTMRCMIYKQAPPGEYKVRFYYALESPDEREGVEIKYVEKEFKIVR